MRIYGRIAYNGGGQTYEYVVTDLTTDYGLLATEEDVCYTDKPLADPFSLKLNGDVDPDWVEINDNLFE